ncbi:MAG: YbbR-like domain-containing protein [Bacteroidales bacterium]|nr:YbbR-like domain-containing protein [Bacteroidales bacterium]
MVLKAGRLSTVTRLFGQRNSKLRSRLWVFFVCLLLSFSIWTIIRLNREYDLQIQRAALYVNPPKNRVIGAYSDSMVSLRLKVKGMRLLSMKYMENSRPVTIDLSQVRFLKKNHGHFNAYLTSGDLLPQLTAELNVEGRLDNVSPDTLYFRFEKLKKKKLPVRIKALLSFDKQFMLYDSIRPVPDSVWVSGPARILDTLRYVSNIPIELKNLRESREANVKLQQPLSGINLDYAPPEIKLEISVERYTEATVDVAVESFPAGDCRFKTFPEKVKLSVQVPLRDFKSLDPSQFAVVADCSVANQQSGGRIAVRVLRHPPLTKVILLEPSSVEFILQQ